MNYWGRIIDAHIHIRGGFGDLNGFTAGMEQMRIESGVDAVAIASVPAWDTECIGQNVISLVQKALYPDTTYVLAGLDYHMPPGVAREDFAVQARRFMEMGCDGIKMLEGKPHVRKLLGNIPLNSPLYDGFYAYLEREQELLLLHAADPATFWDDRTLPAFARDSGWGYTDGTFASMEQIQEETEDVLARYPGLKMQLAHFYFVSTDIGRAARLLDRYPNVSLDITPGTEMFADFSQHRDEWKDFFTQYSGRIVFGTDNGWGASVPMEEKIARAADFVSDMRRFLETSDEFRAFAGFDMPLKGLDLDEQALENIYWRNFVRLASDKPRKLEMDRVIAYVQMLVDRYQKTDMPQYELFFPQMEECLAKLKGI